ncbi:uncharacterized protein LOC130747225 [Lotus japonicus]|uniref:uncharacterized protein LOC130747225 n=1 Tax=Lotus japonicus TaxID=34305 RepID=UPI0025878B9F|nr:uncharacterized protein LOC130747225 [Lotus japonicus]
MDNQLQRNPLLTWAYFCQGKSMEELKQTLMYTTLELEQTRTVVQDELRKRDEQVLTLKELLNRVMRERDEAQEKCQRLLLEKLVFQKQQQLSGISSIEDDPRRGIDSNNGLSSSDCEESIVSSPVIDHFHQLPPPPPQPQPQPLPSMTELISPDKPLPEKGKLLQAVMKAGPLLQTLLLAGPLPQWRHPPPPLESFEIPPVTIPSPQPQLLHQDSFNTNGSTGGTGTGTGTGTATATNCGRFSRKRVLCDGSDSPAETKYQRIVLH